MCFLFSSAAQARDVRVTTWNMSWLTLRGAQDSSMPADVYRRTDADIAKLSGYAARLGSDVIAFQEVDGAGVAARVFQAPTYKIFITNDPVVQRVGVAVRNTLTVERHPDVTALNVYSAQAPHPLRSGLDITVSDGKGSLRILVVHLKTGCWDNPPDEQKHACPTLQSQFAVLSDWILERQDEGEAFAVLGDFNRRMTPGDPFFHELATSAPLLLTTAGHASPCWGGEYFIDHILLGGAAKNWLVPDSLRVMSYKHDGTSPKALSDHCPVSVELSLP
ncbi:endonuclease/exonuclease/phosphatase family protein [Acetobacter sp. LMG 1627]|uniref:Endonuclease/exonuclease/phosphatase family protein n=2 Tax=Acetobacter conturbans TaxID=1737472 RepID=A0ABX0K1R2_9PROT|nr:endonuclease/exonuclease/phosphatase family protein [Acetobacter conturbans]NHN88218.1 endonuclease/exonuclease/phosphatase family protein [Acetobacter conturbans]